MTIDIRTRLGKRFTHKRELGVPLRKRGECGSVENDIEAGLAEKFGVEGLGCKFRDEILDGGDEGWDCIYRGQKVDIKWMGLVNGAPRQSGRIMVDIGKLKAAIYVAVIGSEKTGFRYLGWCTAKDLLDAPFFKVPWADGNGRFERYAVHTNDLRKMQQLIEGK